MSLLRTLAAVAVGVAATKGAQALADRNRRGSGGGGGGLLDGLTGDRGGLGRMLAGGNGQAAGGLGGILEELGGSGAMGGLGGMLAGGAGAGGAAGLLGGLLGRGGGQPDMGRRLNEALFNGGEPSDPPTEDEEAMAALMIRAMIMAAKADGRIDNAERAALLDRLGDLDANERRFVEDELNAPLDVRDFARDVPNHPALRAQIFAAAMSAIDIDNARERDFAADMAQELGLDDKARGHVQRRMSNHYGDLPEGPLEKTDAPQGWSTPIRDVPEYARGRK